MASKHYKYKNGAYPTVTLCGSSKFKDDFMKASKELSLTGHLVISLRLFGHADNEFGTSITPAAKAMLDTVHRQKIDISDWILVINRDDYIGRSTADEIEYAHYIGIPVHYYYPHNGKD